MHVLSFETARTLLVSYGLHPDCIGGTQYSADYPYHLTQFVRETLGDGWNVLYLNAACGNINHVDVRNPDQRSSYEESRRIGWTLARAALKAREQGKELNIQSLSSRTKTAPCALRKTPPGVAQRAELEVRNGVDFEWRNFNELFSPGAYVLNKTRDRFHPAEIIVFRIGALGLAGGSVRRNRKGDPAEIALPAHAGHWGHGRLHGLHASRARIRGRPDTKPATAAPATSLPHRRSGFGRRSISCARFGDEGRMTT